MKNFMVSVLFFICYTYSIAAAEIYAQQSLYHDIMHIISNESSHTLSMLNQSYQNMRTQYGSFLVTDWIAAFQTKQLIQYNYLNNYIYSCNYPLLNYVNSYQSKTIPAFFSTLYSFLIDASSEFPIKNMTYQYFIHQLSHGTNKKYDAFLRKYNHYFISIILGEL